MPVQVDAQPHVLACKSFIMGTCNLLIVGLPRGWRLQTGPFPPEVERWRDFGGVNWALAGRGFYRTFRPGGGRSPAALLRVQVCRLDSREADALADARRALAGVDTWGESPFHGHQGSWALGEVHQGFGPWRRPLPALAVGLACPATRRAVRLLVESESRDDLATLLEVNRACWACH